VNSERHTKALELSLEHYTRDHSLRASGSNIFEFVGSLAADLCPLRKSEADTRLVHCAHRIVLRPLFTLSSRQYACKAYVPES
jgi:hypothetical protein